MALSGVLFLCALFALSRYSFTSNHISMRQLHATAAEDPPHSPKPMKILYIVTSIAEFDTGKRKTIEGQDRFVETLIPVVTESVDSMLSSNNGYQVDVYLIAHYTLTAERMDLLKNALHPSVHLQVWNDATPLSYPKANEAETDHIVDITRALSRQHRYVIKDKLLDYDFFVNFEDDMLIHGEHIEQYVTITNEIDRLKKEAPYRLPIHTKSILTVTDALNNFHGNMSKTQLSRVIPGFIRVERAVNATGFQKRTRPGRIPVEPSYLDRSTETLKPLHLNPESCCHRPREEQPPPQPQDLFLWETNIKALGIRKMPTSSFLEWIVLQRGGSVFALESEVLIGDYWSGRDGDFVLGLPTDARPDSMESIYANNQGGWMASRKQIWDWHTRMCIGGFLPPFAQPLLYPLDGMNHAVEYWSGGGNLYGRKACNLQRIIPLDPEEFSRHLVYHTSNNKQKQLKFVKGLFSKVDTLLGQLHTVKKRAEQAMGDEDH